MYLILKGFSYLPTALLVVAGGEATLTRPPDATRTLARCHSRAVHARPGATPPRCFGRFRPTGRPAGEPGDQAAPRTCESSPKIARDKCAWRRISPDAGR